ncbi:MAG: hypothetical protein MI924_07890 [Chloroflexales bacterium]|nr:hypothetical protein [Chloroflexales bacterium]
MGNQLAADVRHAAPVRAPRRPKRWISLALAIHQRLDVVQHVGPLIAHPLARARRRRPGTPSRWPVRAALYGAFTGSSPVRVRPGAAPQNHGLRPSAPERGGGPAY